MWLWESLQNNFATGTHEWRLQVFRIVIGIAVLWKSLASIVYGEWRRLEPGGLDHYILCRRFGVRRATAFAGFHRPLLAIRAIASGALIVGYGAKPAVVLICVSLLYELVNEYRFNTLYLLLCLLLLLPAGALGTNLVLSPQVSSRNTWSQALIVLVTAHLYINSAWLKARSPQFSSGLYLAQLARGASIVGPQLPLWEYRHPAGMVRRSLDYPKHRVYWRLLATGTILLEFSLPVLLIVEPTRAVAVAAGVAMHAAFMAILPIRLAPFTLNALASYLLFVP